MKSCSFSEMGYRSRQFIHLRWSLLFYLDAIGSDPCNSARSENPHEGVLRTIYLYPMALSLIVTGTAWRWILNPGLGVEATVRKWGFQDFSFDWLVNPEMAIFTVVIAAVWQASGFVMALFSLDLGLLKKKSSGRHKLMASRFGGFILLSLSPLWRRYSCPPSLFWRIWQSKL